MNKPYDPKDYAPPGSKTGAEPAPEMLNDKVQIGLTVALILWGLFGMSIVSDSITWSIIFIPLLLVTFGRLLFKYWP